MINLLQKLRDTEVEPGRVAVCSLGQAGFIYKRSNGDYVLIDPYVTDSCATKLGRHFQRIMPSLIDPEELNDLPISAYLITHHHEDHLDEECVRRIVSTEFPFYTPPETIRQLVALGIAADRCFALADGRSYLHAGMEIHGTFADHGELAPDAVGIVFQSDGKTIYHMGDTCLNEGEMKRISEKFAIDLMIAPINGKYGNMDEREAAQAVSLVNPGTAIPCHYWMLPGNSGGNPLAFLEEAESMAPKTRTLMLTQGEIILI
ncbi:MBL fold metallo-hydrolase [Cohnella soli]|uniref:MBL fold metallo-hydrolase n=1 Tax=Cohnella soli TaxID=425005 RepID=A0ABW0I114_9BACL